MQVDGEVNFAPAVHPHAHATTPLRLTRTLPLCRHFIVRARLTSKLTSSQHRLTLGTELGLEQARLKLRASHGK